MSDGISINSVLNLDISQATEQAKKFASKPLILNIVVPSDQIFKSLESGFKNPIKINFDTSQVRQAIADLDRVENKVKSASGNIRASIDTRVNHIVRFDTLKYDSIVAKTVKDSGNDLKRELQSLNRNIRSLRPNQLGNILGFLGKGILSTITAPFRAVGSIGKNLIGNIFTGFTESIGRTFFDGFKPEKGIKNFARKIKIASKRFDQYILGKEQVLETFLSELVRSGDISKAGSVGFDRTRLKKNLDRLAQVQAIASDPKSLEKVLETAPDLNKMYQDIVKTINPTGKLGASQKAKAFKQFLEKAQPKRIIEQIVNPVIEELSPLLRFIQGMQSYKTNVRAQQIYNERKPGFPVLNKDEGIVTVIGGAQFAEGQGGRKVSMALEPLTPNLRFIPVENPDTDAAKVKRPIEQQFETLLKQFAPDLVANTDMMHTVTNVLRQVVFALDPTASSTAAAQAIANTRLAAEQGKKSSVITYSLGGAEGVRYAKAAEYAGLETNTLSMAYPFLNLSKSNPKNYQSTILSGDPLTFPYQLGLGGKVPQTTQIQTKAQGADTHAYKHLFGEIEFLDTYFKTLGQSMPDLSPVAASKFIHTVGNLYELMGAMNQVQSLIKTGNFDLKSPFKGFTGSATGIDVITKFSEYQSLLTTQSALPENLKEVLVKIRSVFSSVEQELTGLMQKSGMVLPPNLEKNLLGFLKYNLEIGKANDTLSAFKTGKIPTHPGADAYFAGDLDFAEVQRRLPTLQDNTIKWFEQHKKQFGDFGDELVNAYKQVERVALEFVQSKGNLSSDFKKNIKLFPSQEFPDDIKKIFNKTLDAQSLPSEEESRVLQVDVPEAFKKTQAAILAYNKLLNSLTGDILPEISNLKKVAYGMSGAAALLSDKLVYKTDLDPAGAHKIGSQQEIAAYEKLQGRFAPLLYKAIPGEALVTERIKGRPLKDILNRIAEPIKRLQEEMARLRESLVDETDETKIRETQAKIREVRAKARQEKARFNKAASILYEQVGRLGATLQAMGVVHNDLASGNVFFAQGGVKAIDLGNAQVLPPGQRGGGQKSGDEFTAHQRALIDREFYGILDPLSTILSINKGFKSPYDLPEARQIDKSLLSPIEKGKSIPLGSETPTLLKQILGTIQGFPERIKLAEIKTDQGLPIDQKPLGKLENKAKDKINEKLLVNAQGDVTPDKGQITKMSDLSYRQVFDVAVRDATVTLDIMQKGAIALNQGFNATLGVLMPAIETIYKLDQGAKRVVTSLIPFSGMLIKGAETLLPAVGFAALTHGTPVGQMLTGATGSVLHPLLGAGSDAIASGLSSSIGGSLETIPLVGHQLGAAFSQGILEASHSAAALLGNLGTEITANLVGAETVKTAIKAAINPVNEQKLKALPAAAQEAIAKVELITGGINKFVTNIQSAELALREARKKGNSELITKYSQEISISIRGINDYLERAYITFKLAKEETKKLPGSGKKGSEFNRIARGDQPRLTSQINELRKSYPEIVDINTAQFKASTEAKQINFEKEAKRVIKEIKQAVKNKEDFSKIGEETIQGWVNGLRGADGLLVPIVAKQARALPEEVRRILDIHSPSGVFEEIGHNIVLGLKNGINFSQPIAKIVAESNELKKRVEGVFEIRSPSAWAKYLMNMIALGMKSGQPEIAAAYGEILNTLLRGKQSIGEYYAKDRLMRRKSIKDLPYYQEALEESRLIQQQKEKDAREASQRANKKIEAQQYYAPFNADKRAKEQRYKMAQMVRNEQILQSKQNYQNAVEQAKAKYKESSSKISETSAQKRQTAESTGLIKLLEYQRKAREYQEKIIADRVAFQRKMDELHIKFNQKSYASGSIQSGLKTLTPLPIKSRGIIDEFNQTQEKAATSRKFNLNEELLRSKGIIEDIANTRKTLSNRLTESSQGKYAATSLKGERLGVEKAILRLQEKSLSVSDKEKVSIDEQIAKLRELLIVNKEKTDEANRQLKVGTVAKKQLNELAIAERELYAAMKAGDAERINAANRNVQGLRQTINQTNTATDSVRNMREQIRTLAGDFHNKLPASIKTSLGWVKMLGAGIVSYLSFTIFNPYDIFFRLQYAIRGVIEEATQMQSIRVQLKNVGGSFEEATQIAERYAVSIKESVKGLAQLGAATKNSPLEGQKTLDILDGFNQASRVYNLTAEEQGGILLALRQIASDAILQMQDFNQLAERIPGLIQVTSRAFNVSPTQFRKLNEQQAFTSADFLTKVSRQLKTETDSALKSALQTPASYIQQMRNELDLFQESAFKNFQGVFTFFVKGLTETIKFGNAALPVIGGISQALLLIGGISLVTSLPAIIGFFQNLGVTAPLVVSGFNAIRDSGANMLSGLRINIPRMASEMRTGLIDGLANMPYLFSDIKNMGGRAFSALGSAIRTAGNAALFLVDTLGPLVVIGVGISAITTLWEENGKAAKNAKEELEAYMQAHNKFLLSDGSNKGTQKAVDVNRKKFKDDLSLFTKIADPLVAIASLNPISFIKDFDRYKNNGLIDTVKENTRSAMLEREEIVKRQEARSQENKVLTEYYNTLQKIKSGGEVSPESVTSAIDFLEKRKQVLSEAKPITTVESNDIKAEQYQIELLLKQYTEYKKALDGLGISYTDVVVQRKKSIDQAAIQETNTLNEIENLYLKGAITQEQSELRKQKATTDRVNAELLAEQTALATLKKLAISRVQIKINEQIEKAKVEEDKKAIARLEQQQRDLNNAIASGKTEALKGFVDDAVVKEIVTTEKKVTEASKKAVTERLKLAKQERENRVKEVEKTAQEVISKATIAEQERQIKITELEKAGIVNKEEAEKLKASSSIDRIKEELKAEEDKITKIKALDISSTEKEALLNAAKQSRNSKVIELLNTQISKQQELKTKVEQTEERVKKYADLEIAKRDKILEAQEKQLDFDQQRLDIIVQIGDRVKELEQARYDFGKTSSDAEVSFLDLQKQQLQRALEIKRQLTSEEANNLSNGQRKALIEELATLGVSGKKTELQIINEIAAIERETSAKKLESVQKEFELKKKMLEFDEKRAELESAKNILGIQKEQLNARGRITKGETRIDSITAEINRYYDRIAKTKSPEERQKLEDKIAELRAEKEGILVDLELADKELDLAGQRLDQEYRHRETLKEINDLKREGLAIEEKTAIATERVNQNTAANQRKNEAAAAGRDEFSFLKRERDKLIKEAQGTAKPDKEGQKALQDRIAEINKDYDSKVAAERAKIKRGNSIEDAKGINPVIPGRSELTTPSTFRSPYDAIYEGIKQGKPAPYVAPILPNVPGYDNGVQKPHPSILSNAQPLPFPTQLKVDLGDIKGQLIAIAGHLSKVKGNTVTANVEVATSDNNEMLRQLTNVIKDSVAVAYNY